MVIEKTPRGERRHIEDHDKKQWSTKKPYPSAFRLKETEKKEGKAELGGEGQKQGAKTRLGGERTVNRWRCTREEKLNQKNPKKEPAIGETTGPRDEVPWGIKRLKKVGLEKRGGGKKKKGGGQKSENIAGRERLKTRRGTNRGNEKRVPSY